MIESYHFLFSSAFLKLLALLSKTNQKTFFSPLFQFYSSQILITGVCTMVKCQERSHQNVLKTKWYGKKRSAIYLRNDIMEWWNFRNGKSFIARSGFRSCLFHLLAPHFRQLTLPVWMSMSSSEKHWHYYSWDKCHTGMILKPSTC